MTNREERKEWEVLGRRAMVSKGFGIYPGQRWLYNGGDCLERIDEDYWTLDSEDFSIDGFRGFNDFDRDEGWPDLRDFGTVGILFTQATRYWEGNLCVDLTPNFTTLYCGPDAEIEFYAKTFAEALVLSLEGKT